MIVVPLSHRGQCVGVLKAFSSEPGHFSDGDAAVLGLLSRVVGTTMYWATRYGESDLFHRATHDDLTGLANRALFMDRLHAAIGGPAQGGPAGGDAAGHGRPQADQRWPCRGRRHPDGVRLRLNQTVGERELVARWAATSLRCCCPTRARSMTSTPWSSGCGRLAAFRGRGPAAAPVGQLGRGPVPRDADGADELLALADERMFKAKRARKALAEEGQADGDLFI
jgi:hypothetical protein